MRIFNEKCFSYNTFGKFDLYLKNISTLELFSRVYKNFDKCQTLKVYKILCENCDYIYLKQTERALSLRIKEHKYCVKTNRYSALTVYSSIGHCVNLSNAYIMYLENSPKKRIIAETLFIKNSQTFPENKTLFDLNVF